MTVRKNFLSLTTVAVAAAASYALISLDTQGVNGATIAPPAPAKAPATTPKPTASPVAPAAS